MSEILTGAIIAFAGKTIPTGWELCDGREVSSTDNKYRDLFKVIGTVWGGNGNPNFRLPDLKGTFLRGVDTTDELSLGGGSENHNHGGQTSGLINADGYHVSPDNRHLSPQANGYLHGHSISSVLHLPPYKMVIFLIKL